MPSQLSLHVTGLLCCDTVSPRRSLCCGFWLCGHRVGGKGSRSLEVPAVFQETALRPSDGRVCLRQRSEAHAQRYSLHLSDHLLQGLHDIQVR